MDTKSTEAIPETKKPFPWPLCLSFLTLGANVGVELWLWARQDTMLMLRFAWVVSCSVLPGLALIAFIGSLVQFRRRSICSSVSILVCILLFTSTILLIEIAVRGVQALR